MNTPQRFSLVTQSSPSAARDGGYGAPRVTVNRSQVLPTRHASVQLELPLAMPPTAARQRVRIG